MKPTNFTIFTLLLYCLLLVSCHTKPPTETKATATTLNLTKPSPVKPSKQGKLARFSEVGDVLSVPIVEREPAAPTNLQAAMQGLSRHERKLYLKNLGGPKKIKISDSGNTKIEAPRRVDNSVRAGKGGVASTGNGNNIVPPPIAKEDEGLPWWGWGLLVLVPTGWVMWKLRPAIFRV